jgi:hypothetical protein
VCDGRGEVVVPISASGTTTAGVGASGSGAISELFWLAVWLAGAGLVIAVVIFTIGVPVSFWMNADGTLRPLLEVLPSSIVADTAEASGQPIVIGALILAGVAAAVYALSRWRRQLIHRFFQGEVTYPALLGLSVGRMLMIIGGLSLAFVAGAIADGADLRENGAEGTLTKLWQIGFALVGMTALSVYGLRHRIDKEAEREGAAADGDGTKSGLPRGPDLPDLLARRLRRAR